MEMGTTTRIVHPLWFPIFSLFTEYILELFTRSFWKYGHIFCNHRIHFRIVHPQNREKIGNMVIFFDHVFGDFLSSCHLIKRTFTFPTEEDKTRKSTFHLSELSLSWSWRGYSTLTGLTACSQHSRRKIILLTRWEPM